MRVKRSDMTPCVCGAPRRLIEFVTDYGGARYKDAYFFRCLQCDRSTRHTLGDFTYTVAEAKQAWEELQQKARTTKS